MNKNVIAKFGGADRPRGAVRPELRIFSARGAVRPELRILRSSCSETTQSGTD